MSKPALGRGLGALLGGARPKPPPDPATPSASGTDPAPPGTDLPTPQPSPVIRPGDDVRHVPIAQVGPSPLQPRKHIAPEALQELADSIRANGILQPLLVRPVAGRFELIAGERRWRAAQLAGRTEVPVLIRTASDGEVLEMALIENLQRENLDPIEEALGYQQLQSQFHLTQEQIAGRVGRSRVAVANALRLLKLAPACQDALRNGGLSVGHAKVLLGLVDPARQTQATQAVLSRNLNVRQTEQLVSRMLAEPVRAHPDAPASPADPHVTDLENRLRERFATRVSLAYRAGKGSLEIRFHSDDELQRILDLLGLPPG